MEDNINDVEETEVKSERKPADLSIRQKLRQQLRSESSEPEEDNPSEEPAQEAEETVVTDQPVSEATPEVVQPQAPLMVPPADMNAAEKEAFLNPTPANAHVLQSYLNRRAYETRSDYSRKMQEVEQLKKQTAGLYDTIRQYEEEYAKDGISIADVTKRAIAWDKAMQKDPVATAMDWLDAHGVNVNDLLNQQPNQVQQQNYLTREEAERIAEERYRALTQEQEKKAVDYYNEQVVNLFKANKPLFRDPETATQLETEMAPVVQALSQTGRYSSPEQVLETAYNYVVNGNPTFSSLTSKMAAGPVVQQQQATAQKAKAAAKTISGSAGSGTPRIQAQNLRDNLQRRFVGE